MKNKSAKINFLQSAGPWIVSFAFLSGLHLTNVSSELGGNLGGDNVVYYLLSQALATGQGYVDLYLPGHPAHLKYPFLFPLLLTPFHWVFQNPIPAMHVMVALFNAGAAVALGIWSAGRFNSRWTGLGFALVAGTLPRLYLQSGHLLTEPVFMAFCCLALMVSPSEKGEHLKPGRFMLLTLLILAAFFTRTTGVALFMAMCFLLWRTKAFIKRGERKFPAWIALLLIFGISAFFWTMRNRLAGGGQGISYLDYFVNVGRSSSGGITMNDLLMRVYTNIKFHFPFLGNHCFTPAWTAQVPYTYFLVIGYVLLMLVIAGLVLEIRRGLYSAEVFFVASIAIVVLWPFREDRFILPVLPLACFYLLRALEWAFGLIWKPKMASRVLAGVFVVVLVCQGYLVAGFMSDRLADGRAPVSKVYVGGYGPWTRPVVNWAKYDIRFTGVNQATLNLLTDYFIINKVAKKLVPEHSVILSRKPMYTYFFSGRESVPIISKSGPQEQWEYLQEENVGYIIVGLGERESALEPMLAQWPDRFQEVASISPGIVKILKVKRQGEEK